MNLVASFAVVNKYFIKLNELYSHNTSQLALIMFQFCVKI